MVRPPCAGIYISSTFSGLGVLDPFSVTVNIHTQHIFPSVQMALQFYSPAALSSCVQNSVAHKINSSQPAVCCAGDYRRMMMRTERRLIVGSRVKASLDAAAPTAVAEVGRVTEVSMHTFWPIVKAAGTNVVVVDMYTQWCGPCKVMAPKFQQLSEKYDDVIFLKLDCNQDNRPLAKELGIKVVPTFKILKDSKIVKEVTGAKYDDLVVAIENARIS